MSVLKSGNQKLLSAIIADDSEAVLRAVRSKGGDPNGDCGDNLGTRMIMIAAKFRKLNALRTLIELNADVNSTDKCGSTAVLATVRADPFSISSGVYKILQSAGADFLKRDMFGDTAIGVAARYGSLPLVELLLNTGARVTDSVTRQLIQNMQSESNLRNR